VSGMQKRDRIGRTPLRVLYHSRVLVLGRSVWLRRRSAALRSPVSSIVGK
jgi:hypothetical protein